MKMKHIKDSSEYKSINVYHGGNLDSYDGVFYVSPDKNQSIEYAKGNDGYLYTYRLDTSNICTEETARTAMEKLGLESPHDLEYDEYLLHEWIDERFDSSLSSSDIDKLFDYLIDSGYEGISFTDEDITGMKRSMENIVIFNPKETLVEINKEEV
jgi:hypothetical protein